MPIDKQALAALPTLAVMTDEHGTTWHLKENSRRGQLWLREDGARVRVYHWSDWGPVFVREE